MDLDLTFFADASYIGEKDDEDSGQDISGGGDVNGDGIPDFMIGAANYGDNQEGMTYLFLTFSSPPVPDSLKGTSAPDASSITLTWTDPAFWNEPISGIRIYKSTDGSNYKHIGTAAPGDQKYSDQDVILGKTYYYAVVSVDGEGALSGMGAPIAVLCDIDTDGDGFSDAIDADDDGDGIPDFSDAFPLDSKEWLDTDLDGTGNNKDTDDDNDGWLDINDAQPLNPLNGIQGDINYLNTTVKKVGIDVANMRTELNSMNGNITALGTDIDQMGTTLTTMMDSLGSELDGMNDTMQDQIDTLGTELQGVNASVKKDINSMATELHSFRLETSASLKEIKDLLAKHDKDMKAETANLNKTINQLETKNLAQIMGELTIIEAELKALGINDTALMTKITETKTAIASFKTSMDSKLGNITTDLGKLDTIQTSINDLKKTQKTTNSNVEATGTRDAIMMALIALVIVLVIVGLVSGKKKKTNA
jgi:archaellum component FlaC